MKSVARIHITALSPRSGTTLLAEAMAACFDIDAARDHEASVLSAPISHGRAYCSKDPNDIELAEWALRLNRSLSIICVIRDPRDVVVSKHMANPNKFCTNLRIWKRGLRALRGLSAHPRVLSIKYEDLARSPDTIQGVIADYLPFLHAIAPFSRFETLASPSPEATRAMNGLRAIGPDRIGSWKLHRDRLAAQIALHGSVSAAMEELGYVDNAQWEKELATIHPRNGETVQAEYQTILESMKERLRQAQSITYCALTRGNKSRRSRRPRWPA